MSKKLELMWLGKEKPFLPEPRLLVEDTTKSYSNDSASLLSGESITDNMLIHGDNLLALKALMPLYQGKVKCIYIDPPYNTGSAFENYDDNVEHSLWLSLMKGRLEMLRDLLRDDGIIFIQIDDNEQAYLKVLCDEVFGRKNFVNCIAVKMSPSSGVKRRFATIKYIKNKEYILVYKKRDVEIKPIYDPIDEYDPNYDIFFNGKEFTTLKEKIMQLDAKFEYIDITQYLKNSKIKSFIVKNKDNIYRRHGHSKWVNGLISDSNQIFKKCEEYKPRSRVWKVYNPSNPNEYEIIMNTKSGFERLEPISWKFVGDELTLLRGDLWTGYESDMGNVSKEGKTGPDIFGEGQKPERLISDIIRSTTNEGDIVLDSFLGSGTTAAVAHKMKRKWIGIEMGNHAYTLCKPRIDSVINGEQSGVSERENWNGGGGYKFYELAPTLINIDSFGQPIINKEYNSDMLAAAVAIHEGFRYSPDEECYWKQAKNDNNTYLYVTTNHVNEDVINGIKAEMKDDEFLILVCKSYDESLKKAYKNITIKKIPQSLLKNCEFGIENYDLNIICPPEYEYEEDE